MKAILVPIDLAHESSWKVALPRAFDHAEALNLEVTIMTVVPEIPAGIDARYAIRGEMQGSEELDVSGMLLHAKDRLEDIGKQHAPADRAFNVVVRYGIVYQEVLDVAGELDVDQIIMAAHRPSLADYLIGPNTARVVRHATCSVQVIR